MSKRILVFIYLVCFCCTPMFAQETGVCCYGDDQCMEDTNEAICSILRGTFFPNGTCQLCTGSCCYDDDRACEDNVGQNYCEGAGGTWNRAGTCQFDCPEVGSCCYTFTGSCQNNMTLEHCVTLGGVWTRDGNCAQDCPMGSCCYDDGRPCQNNVNQSFCSIMGGLWNQGGTCDVDCPELGSCCYPGVLPCADNVTRSYCDATGGSWNQGGTCESDCPALGSCCYSDGHPCQDNVSQSYCEGVGGSWNFGGNCILDCPSGRCCYTDPTPDALMCDDTHTRAFCDNLSGDFSAFETCSSSPCVEPCSPDPEQAVFSWPESLGQSQCLYLCPGIFTTIVVGPGLSELQEPIMWFSYGCEFVPDTPNSCNNPGCPPPTALNWLPWTYNTATETWSRQVQAEEGTEPGCLCAFLDDILPVELASFNALPGDKSVTLKWSTASETDNDYFDIIRNETIVGRVDASNSAIGHDYSWTENNLTNGLEYIYKLISVDMSGNSEEIGTVSATPVFNAATVTEYALHQNYPNPFNPSTSITFDLLKAGYTTIVVYNTIGQTIATLVNSEMPAGRHTINFDAAALPSGLYLYRMDAGDFSAVRKMILMK